MLLFSFKVWRLVLLLVVVVIKATSSLLFIVRGKKHRYFLFLASAVCYLTDYLSKQHTETLT